MVDIREIKLLEDKRRQHRKELYKKIYEMFERKIRQCVELNATNVFLTVPSLVMGFPAFDRAVACNYLARQLRNGGFEVRHVGDHDLYVSWAQASGSSRRKEPSREEEVDPLLDDFPTLMNLKKAANKYRK